VIDEFVKSRRAISCSSVLLVEDFQERDEQLCWHQCRYKVITELAC
jgi:hypothetical protein